LADGFDGFFVPRPATECAFSAGLLLRYMRFAK